MLSHKKNHEYALLEDEEGGEGSHPLATTYYNHSWWNSKALQGIFRLAIGSLLLFNIFQLTLWLSGRKANVLGDRSTTAYGMRQNCLY